MPSQEDLRKQLQRIDGRPYPTYKDIRGRFDFGDFILNIDKVQGDPFAAPSRLSVEIDHSVSKLPTQLFSNRSRRTGCENFLALAFSDACRSAERSAGSGKSGLIAIDRPGQEMLERSCLEIGSDKTTARFSVGLPAQGRRIKGRAAAQLLLEQIPKIVASALLFHNLDSAAIQSFADTAEDADTLRLQLGERKLIAFVANGSNLARQSGIDPRPLEGAVRFESPRSLVQEFELPNAGIVSGMAIPEGVTLIVGGGYHGKSTLLAALENGIYNHRPGDGRELVITRSDATKVRAEDGRSVAGVDLSAFIGQLPGGKNSTKFSTENASGSSSQAAAIVETLETGAKALLLDEDISATNLLIRDSRMQRLIAPEKEPITPLVQRARSLSDDLHVSTILVLGGSGDYFEPADLVIAMDHYRPLDLTAEAKQICQAMPLELPPSQLPAIATDPVQSQRYAFADSIDPYTRSRGRDLRPKVKVRDARALQFGENEIDLSLIPQLVESSQARAIGAFLLHSCKQRYFEDYPIPEALRLTLADANSSRLSSMGSGDLAEIRLQELAAALNRLRSLRIR